MSDPPLVCHGPGLKELIQSEVNFTFRSVRGLVIRQEEQSIEQRKSSDMVHCLFKEHIFNCIGSVYSEGVCIVSRVFKWNQYKLGAEHMAQI